MNSAPSVGLLCAALVCLAVAAPLAVADLVTPLIRVDVSNPAAVTFHATGAASWVDDSSSVGLQGVVLQDFFTANAVIPIDTPISGVFSPADESFVYDSLDDYPADVHLNLYAYGQMETTEFSTDSPAFVGNATVDLTGLPLPAIGASGEITVSTFTNKSAASPGSGVVLGQWVAVPEPSAFMYSGLIAALAGCGYRLKRRLA